MFVKATHTAPDGSVTTVEFDPTERSTGDLSPSSHPGTEDDGARALRELEQFLGRTSIKVEYEDPLRVEKTKILKSRGYTWDNAKEVKAWVRNS